ncbi:sensor histidine kinase [Gimibacter soli]|uniref:histidine kinase n=1 Tax=Gimibacter soli TaxID=3024400 RepID=A0AAF0BI19_9PROT|nr:ATP-binding protein [Gimibacter soli]WCL54838.1 ATP-binding protein [Gimibacter soli]
MTERAVNSEAAETRSSPWRRMLVSVRAKLFLGFAAMGLLVVGVGLYAYVAIGRAGEIVEDIYNRPLMAINFTRAASFDFSQMQARYLKLRERGEKSGKSLDELHELVHDDLAVAHERALTDRSRRMIEQLRRDIDAWVYTVKGLLITPDPRAVANLDATTDDIIERFDIVVELQSAAGFEERQKAVTEIATTVRVNVAVTGVALMLAIAVTLLLARLLLGPLLSASESASRIAKGELDTPIPEGGADETGRLLRALRVMQKSIIDLVSREKYQKQKAEDRLLDALANSREAIIIVDADGLIVMVNDTASALFSRLGPLVGERFNRLFYTNGVPVAEEDRAVAVASASSEPGAAVEMQLENGNWLRHSRSRTRDGGLFALWSDITEVKAREVQLLVAKQEAEAANEVKSRFLSNMSHELRTPLNAIIGFADVIVTETHEQERLAGITGHAREIQSGGDHLLRIINNVLDLTRHDHGKVIVRLQRTDLGALLEQCRGMMIAEAEARGIRLRYQEPVGTAWSKIDPAQILQSLLNILSNAIKFSHDGAAVDISIDTHIGNEHHVRISDAGIGIDPKDIPVALTAFGQVESSRDRHYEGTGLGLTLAKALIEQNGGRLILESELGVGTMVTVALSVDGEESQTVEFDDDDFI